MKHATYALYSATKETEQSLYTVVLQCVSMDLLRNIEQWSELLYRCNDLCTGLHKILRLLLICA